MSRSPRFSLSVKAGLILFAVVALLLWAVTAHTGSSSTTNTR